MVQTTSKAPASGQKEAPTARIDKAVDFRRVNELTASKCKTGHYARALAARGQIRPIKLNSRTIRYSEASVLALIAGKENRA
jgi:hypothetical protein